jgi:sialic acid synthase SpsE/sugar phosphate isomerase/epimerase
MIIDRQIKKITISPEESVINALQKMCQTSSRLILLTSESGVLEGVFTDGDLRLWLARQNNADLTRPVAEAANRSFIYARATESPEKIVKLFSETVRFLPLVDALGRLVALATNYETQLKIGDFVLDGSGPVFVIAEIGNNHNGDINLAKLLVDHALAAGANCVKFQIRHMSALYRNTGNSNSSDEDLGAQYVMDLLAKFQLRDEQLFEVFDYCKAKGIMPMCTAWDLSSLASLERYGLAAYKVASADLTNHELLEALARTGKPLVVSTGMSDEDEIMQAVNLLKKKGAPFILLHCNSTYPTPFHDINLNYIQRLKEISQVPVGYSGHERGYHVTLAAVALGAVVIEKHITLDRGMEGSDHKASLLPNEFGSMISSIREIEQSLGIGGERKPSQGEIINRNTLAKSLVCSRAIEIGETITKEDMLVRSPGRGLQPNYRDRLIGVKSKRRMEPGDFFFIGDIIENTYESRSYKFRRPWGIPVRYHDYKAISSKSNPDLLEFHLSYKDLDLDFRNYLETVYPSTKFVVHAPELFSGDHLLDLCSFDEEYRKRSIFEMQRVIDLTKELAQKFPSTNRPMIVTNVGGFSSDRLLTKCEVAEKIVNLSNSLLQLDREGVEIIPQTMPPYPWHFGGQSLHNLFVEDTQIVDLCQKLELRICFDVSHSKLACNKLSHSFLEFVKMVGPYTAHLHIADASGVDGEGLQIGEGDIDFAALAQMLELTCPMASFIPEVWQGHNNEGEGFWRALTALEKIF